MTRDQLINALVRMETGQQNTATSEPVAVSAIPGSAPLGSEQDSTPMVGAYRSSDHQYWMNGVGPYYSVTTMLDIMDKPALREWLKRVIASLAVEQYPELGQRILRDGAAAATEWLRGMPGYQRNTAATLGTKVHLLADMLARQPEGHQIDGAGFQVSERVRPYLDGFVAFLDRYSRSAIVSSEKMVISFSEGYAGTYDFLMTIDGQVWLVDVKTGRFGFYPETGLQLAAYGFADYIILPDDPTLYRMPHIDRYAVLHLPGDGTYDFREYDIRLSDYRAFLAARDLWAWRKEGRFKNLNPVP